VVMSIRRWQDHKCICFIWQTIESSFTSFDKLIEDYSDDEYWLRVPANTHEEYSKV